MGTTVIGIITACVALLCGIISIRQFKNKGFLFNNEYIYATKAERKKMNLKPHYRQSGIVFGSLAGIFLFLTIKILTGANWLNYPIGILTAGVIIYAIASSIRIGKDKK